MRRRVDELLAELGFVKGRLVEESGRARSAEAAAAVAPPRAGTPCSTWGGIRFSDPANPAARERGGK